MTRRDEDVWFEPKRIGYGSGLPIAWQGWVLMLGYILAAALAGMLVSPRSMIAFIVIFVALTAAFSVICAQHTRGGWKWRSGREE